MNGRKLFLWLCVLTVLTLPMVACSGPGRETEQEAGNAEVATGVETDAADKAGDAGDAGDGAGIEEVATESDQVDADIDLGDAGIIAKVKTKYAADEAVRALDIDVDAQDGVVTLSGNVADQGAKDKAEELARATEGVKQVVNNLTVGEDKDDKDTESGS